MRQDAIQIELMKVTAAANNPAVHSCRHNSLPHKPILSRGPSHHFLKLPHTYTYFAVVVSCLQLSVCICHSGSSKEFVIEDTGNMTPAGICKLLKLLTSSSSSPLSSPPSSA